jgi:hypothetical protein
MTELKRLVLDYRTGELVVRCLYRSKGETNPGTVRRRREVSNLVRGGLQDALSALEGDVEVVETSGFYHPRRCLMYNPGGCARNRT